MPAGVAVDARETVMRIAALDEALDHLPLDRAPQPARLAQLDDALRRHIDPAKLSVLKAGDFR